MKTYKLLIVTLLALSAFVGCKKDDDEAGSVISAEGTLTGELSNVSNWAVDSIACLIEISRSPYEMPVGHVLIEEDGDFSLCLDGVDDQYLSDVSSDDLYFWDDYTLISDPTAKISSNLWFEAYKNDDYVGEIYRTNVNVDDIDTEIPPKGAVIAWFVYSNKPVEIKATSSDDYEDDGVSFSEEIVFNLQLQQGWNELILKVTDVNQSGYTVMVTANNEPKGMKWLFVPEYDEEAFVKQKSMSIRGIRSVSSMLKKAQELKH